MSSASPVEFESFLRLSPWPAAILDESGAFRYVNAAFAHLLGVTEIQLFGKNAAHFIRCTDVNLSFPDFVSDVLSTEAWHGDLTIFESEGQSRISFVVQRNPSDPRQVFLYSTSAPVVNGRKVLSSKSELRLLKILMDNSLDYVFLKDTRGRYILTNRAYQEFLNVPYEGYEIGRGPVDFTDPETARMSDQDDRETLESGKPLVNRMIKHVLPDGSIRWLQATKVPVYDSEGGAIGIVCISRDVTQTKEREHALVLARENAEKANRAKSQFLANMSHEIRTPLNGIIGMAELCSEFDVKSDQTGYLETILSCGNTLLSLVNDVLDFSKIEAGLMLFEQRRFNLVRVLEETVYSLYAQASGSGVELVTNIDPASPEFYIGDEQRFKQIVYNLVGNALKFTGAGSVSVELREIEEPSGNRKTRLLIRDSGIGIPTNRLVEIFDTFTQVDMTTTREFGGTGLGLAICREIVEQMGGQIFVSSELDQGTTFAIYLNLAPCPETEDPWRQEFAKNDGLNVIIAHRSTHVCGAIEPILRFYGLKPTVVHTPELVIAETFGENGADWSGLIISEDEILSALCDGHAYGSAFRRLFLKQPSISISGNPELGRNNRVPGRCLSLHRLIKKTELLEKVAEALRESNKYGRQTFFEGLESPEILSSTAINNDSTHSVPQPRFSFLLVEDNPINQQVAFKRMQRMGITVELAENGAEALKLFNRKNYDAVLMDVQMPVMDGFEATRKIRASERERRVRTPIIAMTARALEGDRESCLQAGMDYYLSKPFRAAVFEKLLEDNQLFATIEQNRRIRELEVTSTVGNKSLDEIIFQTFDDLISEDQRGFLDAAEVFLTTALDEKATLERLCNDRKYVEIRQRAHSLKGIISIFGASRLVDLLQKIENLASEEDLPALKGAFNEVWTLYHELVEILKQYVISNS